MSLHQQNIKSKIINLRNLVLLQTKTIAVVVLINQVNEAIQNVDLNNQQIARDEIYSELKDTITTIFSYIQKIKNNPSEIINQIEASIKKLLITIVNFTSVYYCKYYPLGCAELLKDFLSSQCRFFVPSLVSAAPQEQIQEAIIQQKIKNWIWAKETSFKSQFYSQIIEKIMINLSKFEDNFGQMSTLVINQYLRLMYYMDDYIKTDRIISLCVGNLQTLQKIFENNPSKQILKDANKESIDDIQDYMLKILRNTKNDQIKKRILLLGSKLAFSMINMQSIQKKMAACKILNKFSYDMMYKSSIYMPQQYFAEWIIKQGFFNIIFEDNCQATLIKSSQDTFKLLVKKGCITQQQFNHFFDILEKADNELRKAMFKLIDPFRIDYKQIEAINNILKKIKGIQFYDEQFFYFYEGVSRFATLIQLKQMIIIVENIINAYYLKFNGYFQKRRAVQCYAYVFDKIVSHQNNDERIQAYKALISNFLDNPCQYQLIILKTIYYSLTDSKFSTYYQHKLAVQVIDDLKFIDRVLLFIQNAAYKEDLLYLIKDIIKKYKQSLQRQGLSKKTLISAVTSPQIFQQILDLVNISQQLDFFSQLTLLSQTIQFPFSCIRFVYCKMNRKYLKPIKKNFTDFIAGYATNHNPNDFIGLQILKTLIFSSKRINIRKGAAELLIQTFTNFQADFRVEGQLYLVEGLQMFAKEIQEKLRDYIENKNNNVGVHGCLQLIEQFMLATQYRGVGSLKSHNSQIPTSATLLKIYNNATYGDNIQKIFQKKFPSNKTLFDVILQVSKQFKIGPLDMGLQFPNNQIIKYHGLTLQQLNLNGIELNAIKLYQSRCKKEPLLLDGQLSPKAKAAFSQIFHKYAVNGEMTHKQCANCIQGLTLSFCSINDFRISDLFAKYDCDKDSKLVESDFLSFYKDSILDPQKEQSVQKNLSHVRYRRDLKLYDQDIDQLNEQILFRYHIVHNKSIYGYLFALVHDNSLQISQFSQRILLRLPTYKQIIKQISQQLNFKDKSSFQTQYMLTALQCSLNEKESVDKLIAKNDHMVIFEKLSYLSGKQIKLQNDHNCLIICLHLLRSLLGNFDLKQFQKCLPQLAFQLPKTDIFIKLIQESIIKQDSTMLQSAFGLQLTQQQLPLNIIGQSAFNKDKQVRVIACNFLYLWIISEKSHDLNLFKVSISLKNNQQWFILLTQIFKLKRFDNLDQIFQDKIHSLSKHTQSLQFCRFNPLVNGNLKILKEIYPQLSSKQKQQLINKLKSLLSILISNQNRSLVFQLMEDNPEDLLEYLSNIVDIKMTKESSPRNKFVGIRNLGSICYMNSILQQFYMIQQFYNLVMSLQSQSTEKQVNGVVLVDDFLSQLQQMYANLQLSQRQYYDPIKFCLAVKDYQGKPINIFVQEDAHEFLNSIFDKIEKYTKKQQKVKVLQNIFGGKTVTQIVCKMCQNKNEVLEHYYHLSVQVKGMKTLKDSFDRLIQTQQISDYFCVHCNKKVDKITKQTLLKQTPQILIINLQRIIFDLQTFQKVKVHTKLQFQQTFNLNSYMSSTNNHALYKLKGIVIHTGTSQGGHYYSLIKHQEKWYKFNDQSVSEFNYSDLGRQAFGGDEATDYWGDQSSSTNAYILFYQKTKETSEEIIEDKISIDETLIEKLKKQNIQFTKQLQFNQPSYFHALRAIFKKISTLSFNSDLIEKLSQIYLRVVDHLSINSDISNQLINQFSEDCLKIITILSSKSAIYLQRINIDKYKEIICTNNDVIIRDLYSKILLKYITLSMNNDDDSLSLVKDRVEALLLLLNDDLLLKNIHKSYQYFQLLKEIICNFKGFKDIFYKKDYLAVLLDILMGNESILFGKDQKRSDIHSAQAIPIIPIITTLILYKKNQKGYSNFMITNDDHYEQLTEKQSKILNESYFYRKMMKNKIDLGLLAPIITLLSYKNQEFSQLIAEVLIKAMNSNEEIQDKSVVFVNLKAFLLVDDEITSQRIKWMFGIPQLDSIRFHQQEFGMMTSSQSKVYSYVSSLFYIKQEKYQPFLNILFEKRKYFNSFSANGILILLQILNDSLRCLQYILQLPAPTYTMRSYVDWIQTYLFKIKKQQHYHLPFDKQVLSSKIQNLLKNYKQRVQQYKLGINLPINKKIIGKNSSCKVMDQYNTNQCYIQVFKHQTYVLDNKPIGIGNQSMPDDQFSFSSTKNQNSKYFLKSEEVGFQQNQNIQKQYSMLTFQIKNKINIIITFNIPNFNNRIYLKEGTHTINAPFHDKKLKDLIQINIIETKIKEMQINLQNNEVLKASPIQIYINNNIQSNITPSMYAQISCSICTYINIGRDKCQICQNPL